jgi:hypothetical protein
MSDPFDGAVLRKARKARSNATTTSDPDIVVLDRDSAQRGKSDRDTYLDAYVHDDIEEQESFLVLAHNTGNIIEGSESIQEEATPINEESTLYQFNEEKYGIDEDTLDIQPSPDQMHVEAGTFSYTSTPSSTPEVSYQRTPLKVDYVRNDRVERFGYNSEKDGWRPRPGSDPTYLGDMPEDGSLDVSELKDGLDPRVVIGSKDSDNGILVPTQKVVENVFEQRKNDPASINTGEAVVNEETGEIVFEESIRDQNIDRPVYDFQYDFFTFDASDGQVGVVGEDVLVLNPLPKDPYQGDTLQPLLRVGFETYLDVSPSSESTGQEDVVWDEQTGRLSFQSTDYEGRTLYYDGVVQNKEPVESYPSQTLGSLGIAHFVQTPSIQPIDGDVYDKDGFFIYVEETGEIIPRIEEVEKPNVEFELGFLDGDEADGFKPAYNLSPRTAQIAKNNNGDWVVQLGLKFKKENKGRTLKAGTGDFLIENGVTFRMRPSSEDPSNTSSTPDAKAFERLVDSTITDDIKRGPFATIEQVPLTDIPGYGENTFFKRSQGLLEQTLKENVDIVHDFSNNQIRWCERVDQSQLITTPVSNVNLDFAALHDEHFEVQVDEGQGFDTLNRGEDILVDFDAGQISFVEEKGTLLYEGSGTLDDDTLTTNEVEFDIQPPPSDPSRDTFNKPILTVNEEDAYRVVQQNSSSELGIHDQAVSTPERVDFRVFEAPEVVFRYGFHNIDLSQRVIYPYRIIDEPSFVPDGESFEFVENGQTVPYQTLDIVSLGTPVDSTGQQNTLYIPPYYRQQEARFDILRDRLTMTDVSPNSPSEADEYRVNLSTGEIVFSQDVYDQFGQSEIIFEPSFSQSRSTGPVEVKTEDRSISTPNDIDVSDLAVRVLLFESDFDRQRNQPSLFFDEPFKRGERLYVEYTNEDGVDVEEEGSFPHRESITVGEGQREVVFGQSKDIDQTKDIRVLINGSPFDGASVRPTDKVVELEPISGQRRLTVEYYVFEAQGGEQVIQTKEGIATSHTTLDTSKEQTFLGDHTSKVEQDDVLVFGTQSFFVESVSFDGTSTNIELQSTPIKSLVDPDIFVSSEPITQLLPVQVHLETNNQGGNQLRLPGNQSRDIMEDHILTLDGDPYPVRNVLYDENNAVTRVEVATSLLDVYDDPTVLQTPYKVYDPETTVLNAQNMAVSSEFFELVRFDSQDNGDVLRKEDQYTFRDDGRIRLNEANVNPPSLGEYWLLMYTGRDVVEPTVLQGNRYNPRLTASYVRFINANDQNFAGQSLEGTYTYRHRDSFYFRIVPLRDMASEITEEAGQQLQQGGPVSGLVSDVENENAGEQTQPLAISDLRDRDRIGRRQIEFFHSVCNELENYLQLMDGRVIGDQDGRFKFFRADDGERGGEDPVTGELIDYYAHPDGSGTPPDPTRIEQTSLDQQESFIRNSIDDIVLVSKKPYDIDFNAPLGLQITFEGTFKSAWEPSAYSRFYPERAEIYTLTTPDRDFVLPDPLPNPIDQSADQRYTFFPDFGNLLADLKYEDILSIDLISDRPAKAWVSDSNVRRVGSDRVEIDVGITQQLDGQPASNNDSGDGTLAEGWNQRRVPGFEQGDLVHLGRTRFQIDDSTGQRVREPIVYAYNMEVDDVLDDSIVLKKASALGPNNTNVLDIATDPLTLLDDVQQPSSALYEAAADQPDQNDTLFVNPTSYYQPPIDVGVNQSSGELTNRTLPQLISNISGQNKPEPLSYLDVHLSFNNTRQSPRRFPALDGALVDDDMDNSPPYTYPINTSEVQTIVQQQNLFQRIKHETVDPTVLNQQRFLSTRSFETDDDLTLNDPRPRIHDVVIVSDILDNQGRAETFSVSSVESNPQRVQLQAKNDQGRAWAIETNVPYTVDSLYDSDGYRDPSNNQRWVDRQGRDFTDFSGALSDLFLHIDTSTYDVVSLQNGSVDTANPINETNGLFRLSIQNRNQGEIQGDRNTLYDSSGIDFSDATGTFSISGSTYNDGTYTVQGGGQNELYPSIIDDPSVGPGAELDVQINQNALIVEGQGRRDVGDDQRWNDTSKNFNNYQHVDALYLHVLNKQNGRTQQISTYEVDTVSQGYVITKETIQETQSKAYALTETSTFGRSLAQADFQSHGQRVLEVSGEASDLNLSAGQTLVIKDVQAFTGIFGDTVNAGHYKITSINSSSGGPTLIHLDRDLRTDQGGFVYRFDAYQSRRSSEHIEDDLRDLLLQRHTIYEKNDQASQNVLHEGTGETMRDLLTDGGYDSNHPSTPSVDVLDRMIDAMFDQRWSDSSARVQQASQSAQNVLYSNAIPFNELRSVEEDDQPDYVLIYTEENRGFYRVGEVLNQDELVLENTSLAQEKGVNFTLNLNADPHRAMNVDILRPDRFDDRTYEIALYETINVLNIIDNIERSVALTFPRPSDLYVDRNESRHFGNPTNETLDAIEQGVFSDLPTGLQDRIVWLQGENNVNLVQEIESILKGRERLYDLRFAWIDYRIRKGPREGTLVQLKRREEEKEEEETRRVYQSLRNDS